MGLLDHVRMMTPGERTEREVEKIIRDNGLVWRDVFSDDRRRKVVRVRAFIVRMLRARGWSYPVIGRYLGRDHSSIMHLMDRYLTDDERRENNLAMEPNDRPRESGV